MNDRIYYNSPPILEMGSRMWAKSQPPVDSLLKPTNKYDDIAYNVHDNFDDNPDKVDDAINVHNDSSNDISNHQNDYICPCGSLVVGSWRLPQLSKGHHFGYKLHFYIKKGLKKCKHCEWQDVLRFPTDSWNEYLVYQEIDLHINHQWYGDQFLLIW